MAENIIFQPVRGTEELINHQPITEGFVYFAYDTGNIYVDKDGGRFLMGGSSTGIVYATGNDATIVKNQPDVDTDYNYTISLIALENSTVLPLPDTLILNSDGRFFRVISTNQAEGTIAASLIAVSGTGGGGSGPIVSTTDIFLDYDSKTIETGYTYIYGKNSEAIFTPSVTTGDSKVTMTFIVTDIITGIEKTLPSVTVNAGVPYKFDTSVLPLSSNITLKVVVTADSSAMPDQSRTWSIRFLKTVEMGIKKGSTAYIPLITADDASGKATLSYVPIGDSSNDAITETLHVTVDGEEYNTEIIAKNGYGRNLTTAVNRQSHGAHTIGLSISATVNNKEIYSDTIYYEVAWAEEDNEDPIVWIGNYDERVINYENSYIQYMVYDPVANRNGLPASITLQKDGKTISEMSLTYNATAWAEWDISAIYGVGDNTFTIACRSAKKDVDIYVTTEGSRDLGLDQEDTLLVNFSSAGRSNLEISTTKGVWTDLTANQVQATLTGFNWQNNGWFKDGLDANGVDNGTYLSIANGATVSIPAPPIKMNDDRDYTIEARFRIRNVQKYSTLIQVLPQYFYLNDDGTMGAKSQTLAWIEANNKTVCVDEWGNMVMDEENTLKTYQTEEGVVCKWLNSDNYGLCLGSQEAYFRSSKGSVNVRYAEDQVINISVVVSRSEGLVYIYLNGILSGAETLPPAGTTGIFTVNSPFVFNSDYCDIDLYRFRIFQTGLTMPNVIHNYLSDLHSIKLYDQNQLTDALTPTQLSYDLLINYNRNHPEELSMPYTVWKITNSGRNEKLPYYKGDTCMAEVTFVNPSLDQALEDGTIDEWFYYTHCPSFTASNVDINVQGTSSQGYPRRNYKTKFKSAADTWVYTKGSLAGQPLTEKYVVKDAAGVDHTLSKKFHMDNEEYGTNKFTWKIDYMESSGTYNTGFANLMGNVEYPLYNKHPVEDIGYSGDGFRTSIYGFPVLAFHEYADSNNNPEEPTMKYEYIGRYNFNLDKSSNEYYGFEMEEEQPYLTVDPWEDEDGNVHTHPLIADVAECWELQDNQGTWTSFKFPSQEARDAGFYTMQDGTTDQLEIFRHFEARYHSKADQLEAIWNDTNSTYQALGGKDQQKFSDEIGASYAQWSNYAYNKGFKNLEVVFKWLDATNPNTATDADMEPVTYKTPKAFTSLGATSELQEDQGYLTTFTKDTADYRLEKFRVEFDKHLDREYCLTYFVLTELLLCYDSRGKNLMLASWGPREQGGEYIWYPIFYDVDTQLGLNNSGAYLWDYDANVTEDSLFSTPNSVLWTNLYTVFGEDVKTKYRVLRGADDGSKSHGSLTYSNIAGAYECNPATFGSYAMRGVRPIIAIGLDEYYKYFAIRTTATGGYFDTNGNIATDAEGKFAYQCQGDKKLTTELLLRNRLNYIDSWWLGGAYSIATIKQGQFGGRVNGNRALLTSDKYSDLTTEEIAAKAALADDTSLTPEQRIHYANFRNLVHADYPKPYFDAKPGYKLKPFLKQYVFYFTDEVPGIPVPYLANDDQIDGVETNVPASTLETFKTDAEMPNEQLNYIPGLDYLSSLGDLSTSYFSEFHLDSGKRLLDLRLGSDIPGYFNDLIEDSKFNITDSSTDAGKKSLLKSINMTGLRKFRLSLDVTGSPKLQEFRALNTQLPNVYFADGAPLHTVHLPESISTLKLIENRDLTKILTSTPIVATLDENGIAQYADPSTYRGLYIGNVTDYRSELQGTGHSLGSLVIEGGGLGYGSYTILENLVKLKVGATTNQNLNVSLKDVIWTPYSAVENGIPYDSSVTYYTLNDHSMYDEYVYIDDIKWNEDTLNGSVYTLNESIDTSIIQDASILDLFIDDYLAAKANNTTGQFANVTGATTATLPTITGTMFIANRNGTAIAEEDLTSKYKVYFPNLEISAENIAEANVTKYVRVLDTGVLETVEILRSASIHPLQPTVQIPSKVNYDFVGWATDPEGVNMFVTYHNARTAEETSGYIDIDNIYNAYEFTNDNNVLILYAIFTVHPWAIKFYNGDTLINTLYVENETAMQTPDIIPYKDDSELPLEQTYKFLGYSLSSTDIDEITSPLPAKARKDLECYAVFTQASVYDNILNDDSYYSINNNGVLVLKSKASTLKGKITFPKAVNNINVKIFNDSGAKADDITHIFFEEGTTLTAIGSRACSGWKLLRYIKLPNAGITAYGNSFSLTPAFFIGISDVDIQYFFDCFSAINENAFGGIGISNSIANIGVGPLIGKSIILQNITTFGVSSCAAWRIAELTVGSINNYIDILGSGMATTVFNGISTDGTFQESQKTYPKMTLYVQEWNNDTTSAQYTTQLNKLGFNSGITIDLTIYTASGNTYSLSTL